MNSNLLASALATPGLVPARRRAELGVATVISGAAHLVPAIPTPHAASGGFSAVVEVSARHCLRLWQEQVPPLEMVALFPPDELRALRDAEPFESAALNGVPIPGAASGLRFAWTVSLSPEALWFEGGGGAARRVCVKYAGMLCLSVEDPGFGREPGELSGAARLRREGPGPEPLRTAESVLPWRERSRTAARRRASAAPGAAEERVSRGLLPDEEARPLRRIADVGAITLELCCAYELTLDAPRVRADVHAKLAGATPTFSAVGADAQRLYGAYLQPLEASLAASLGSAVKLVPTVCPAGRTAPHVAISELPDVDVRAFHVGTAPYQALALAFDLKPGCHGTIEDVRHFIADADFGIVADEYLLDRVLRLKWRLGGFLRTLPLAQTIQIQRDGEVEDATLRGQLSVDGLDQVSIETDSNTRTDYVRLGGPATARATDVLLRDGTVLAPEEVTGAEPQQTRWTVFTGLDTEPAFVPDPILREFARRAREDAVVHVTRPFTHPQAVPQITPAYAAVAGITRHAIALGLIHDPFV